MGKTIYDVAKAAGVSIATVSKVINGTGKISEKTIKHVKEVMKQLHYQPSSIASALTSKRTYTLGVIVPNIANPFFGEVTRVIEKYANESNYTTMVCSTYNSIQKEIDNIQLFLRQQVDGMIIATEQISNEDLAKINTRETPIIKFSAFNDSEKTFSISTDNYKGGQLAAKHLYEQGHQHVWIVGEWNRHSEQCRMQGFIDYYRSKGINIPQTDIFYSDTEYEEANEVANKLFAKEDLPTAIFITTDIVAVILMNTANRRGIRVPEDLSIIGYDNTIFGQLYSPQLTTIAQPVTAMGKRAVESLIDIIEGRLVAPFELQYFEPELIERETVKKLEEGKIC